MNCNEIRRHWDLYHDSEGDAEVHWKISQHLADCPTCAEWFAKQSRWEELIGEKLAVTGNVEPLWQDVLAGAGLARPAATRRWFMFSTLAACAATITVLIGASWLFQTHRADEQMDLSYLGADWHERFVAGDEKPAFKSDSDLAEEAYLIQQVSFPVRCPPRKDSGFAVKGAGTCILGNQPTAFVVGHVNGQPVSMFIFSRASLAAFPHQQAELKTAAIHRCRKGEQEMALSVIDQNLVFVVGRVPPDRLTRMLKAYGSYPHRS